VLLEEPHQYLTKIQTRIYTGKRLKAKKNLPILLVIVEEVAGYRYKSLLKG
jgi:hypothetical protein